MTPCDLCPHLRQSVDQHNREAKRGYDIVYSLGAVQFDAVRHADIADLVAEADALMYRQKKQRNGLGDNDPEFTTPAEGVAWSV